MAEPRKLGPWGNEASQNWSRVLDEGEAIKEIKIRHGDVVDALTFVLVDGDGNLTSTDRYGGSGGKEDVIELHPSKDHITHISGTYGHYCGKLQITSIKIHTHSKPDGYGPFGQQKCASNSEFFSSPPLNGAPIVGFHGGLGEKYIDSVGIYVKQA